MNGPSHVSRAGSGVVAAAGKKRRRLAHVAERPPFRVVLDERRQAQLPTAATGIFAGRSFFFTGLFCESEGTDTGRKRPKAARFFENGAHRKAHALCASIRPGLLPSGSLLYLQALVRANGGVVRSFIVAGVTHVVCTHLASSKLDKPNCRTRLVHPCWIEECVAQNKLLRLDARHQPHRQSEDDRKSSVVRFLQQQKEARANTNADTSASASANTKARNQSASPSKQKQLAIPNHNKTALMASDARRRTRARFARLWRSPRSVRALPRAQRALPR